jgi:hypothetical protein
MQLRPCIEVSSQASNYDYQDCAYEALEVRGIRIGKEVVD